MTRRPPTVLAMGGGGFTMEPREPALDRLALSLTRAAVPRVVFLPTAGGDAREQTTAFHEAFAGEPCEREVLELFRRHGATRGLEEVVLAADLVYVGGGSMRNMLAIWRAHGLHEVLAEAWRRGVVLAGLSAGAMCWFEHGITRSGGPPEPIAGLGLLPGSLSVHDDGEPERAPVFRDAVHAGRLPPGWALDDGAALVLEGAAVVRVVASRPDARATRVTPAGDEVVVPELLTLRRPAAPDPAIDEMRSLRHGPALRS